MKTAKTGKKLSQRPPKKPRAKESGLVHFFQTQKFSPQQCLPLSQKHFTSIVTSLLFHGQPPATSKVDEQLHHFLTWMQNPLHSAGLAPSRPANIDADVILLSRYLLRFLTETDAFESARKSTSLSHAGETAQERQVAGTLTAHVLDSFWASLGELPENDRLVFQFYLEGLFPSEISSLLGEDLSSIQERIQTCKLLLGQKIYDEAA